MITQKEYAKRRDKLGKKLAKNSVGVVLSAEYKKRSNDTEYPYRQNSNFYYLCGFKEDNAALVFCKKRKKVRTLLFVQQKEPLMELWNGKRLGVKKAKKRFEVDEVHAISDLEAKLQELCKEKNTLYYDFGSDNKRLTTVKNAGAKVATHKNIAAPIQKMRLIKSQSEIEIIKKALAITKEAHHGAICAAKEMSHEYKLQAEIEYIFKKHGAYSDAYTSIVACGNHANTLHYVKNDKPLKEGELILIDAGCEYDYYASDITRTIPASGIFSEAQKELYSLVLDTQLQIIAMIKPGIKRTDLQKKACRLLTEGMVRLGILQGKVKKLLKKEAYKRYYPHGIGHWMGLDVHDEAPYKDKHAKEIALAKGMVLTIEPGIYCPKNDKTIPKKYRGIGIRIEDNILVTKKGCENLSNEIVKEIETIETMACKG